MTKDCRLHREVWIGIDFTQAGGRRRQGGIREADTIESSELFSWDTEHRLRDQ